MTGKDYLASRFDHAAFVVLVSCFGGVALGLDGSDASDGASDGASDDDGLQTSVRSGRKGLGRVGKNTYPAVILETNGPTKIKVHYEGYDPIWDEVVTRERIKGFNEGNAPHPEPPPKVRAKALQAAQTNVHKIGDRVRVEWHGSMYPAVIVGIVGQERYRIHFEGYGDEWDDTVGLNRIQQR